MSSTPLANTPLADSPAESESEIAITFVPQDRREEFDALVRGLTGVPTPQPLASEAFVAEDAEGNTQGAAYVQIRHLLGPWVLTDGAGPQVLHRLADAAASSLRSQVQDHLVATKAEQSASELSLAYDIYVPEGADMQLPAEFELLPVRVYRRRVC